MSESADPALDLVVRFARLGHEAGYPAAELEARVQILASSLGLRGVQIADTPTLVEVSIGALPHQRTYTFRVRPSLADLDMIARLDALIDDVLAERTDPSTACVKLAQIKATPLERPWPIVVA